MGVSYETVGTDHFRPVCSLMTSSLLTSSLFEDGFFRGKTGGQLEFAQVVQFLRRWSHYNPEGSVFSMHYA